MAYDPAKLEIYRHLFASIAEEMGAALCRSSYSPNIKERRDFSCALFDAEGQMVAQAAHIPVHLGSMPLSVRAAIEAFRFEPGDMVILNDPFSGGTHLPDITLVAPVFAGNACDDEAPELRFFVANRAHHADVGGIAPGSLPLARSICEEGVRIPPTKLLRRGQLEAGVVERILVEVRTPQEREGDLTAQIAANELGVRRAQELLTRRGGEVLRYARAVLDYAEELTRAAIRAIPDGEHRFEDYLDDDGISDQPVKIAATVAIAGSTAHVDFTGTDPQVEGSVNAVFAVTLSAVYYVFRTLAGADVPSNAGGMRPITVTAPQGSVVNARFPAAVSGGNVETSQRIVDVLYGSLAQALPQTIPAASCGTMTNIAVGGRDARSQAPFAYYETVAGGMGARPGADGLSGVQCHMTNTLNTPIEALEHAYPLRIRRYELRGGSGGEGAQRGGDGLVREMEALTPAELSILSDRRRTRPYGLAGGHPGQAGRNVLIRGGQERRLPGKCNLDLAAGDIVRVETPGGGGLGGTPRRATSRRS